MNDEWRNWMHKIISLVLARLLHAAAPWWSARDVRAHVTSTEGQDQRSRGRLRASRNTWWYFAHLISLVVTNEILKTEENQQNISKQDS